MNSKVVSEEKKLQRKSKRERERDHKREEVTDEIKYEESASSRKVSFKTD